MDRRLPPVPTLPKRPPEEDPLELPTGRTNQPLSLYQTLLASFDALNDAERTDLVELVSAFAGLPSEDRQLLLRLGRRLSR